jgi:hypothetical protein
VNDVIAGLYPERHIVKAGQVFIAVLDEMKQRFYIILVNVLGQHVIFQRTKIIAHTHLCSIYKLGFGNVIARKHFQKSI